MSRCAVVDLGSNSVRLVVFEGLGRNPTPIFNEKAVLRLGRGLQQTGRLNEDGVRQAMGVMARYHALAVAMGAAPFEVLATAAVRDAANGRDFVDGLQARMPGVPIRILSGEAEAGLSTDGVLCGIPDAQGVIADIGGGSLELIRVGPDRPAEAGVTLPLGVIRLADRAGGDIGRARLIAEQDLAGVDWLDGCGGQTLYLVGGAFRTLARIHMEQTGYPLAIVHRYTLERAQAYDLAGAIAGANRRMLERMPGVSRRRVEDLPFAALVLRRLLRASGVSRCVFSATGLREGWFMAQVPAAARRLDPLLAAGMELAGRFGRNGDLPERLVAWTAPLFAGEPGEMPGKLGAQRGLRAAACWMSDIGSYDHPEYRAEQAYLRVLRQPGVVLDHPTRAFLAITLALRYEAEPDAAFLDPARRLLDLAGLRAAEVLGVALRLAYTLSGGTVEMLAQSSIRREGTRLVLRLAEGSGLFAGEGVSRRVERLAQAAGLEAAIEVA